MRAVKWSRFAFAVLAFVTGWLAWRAAQEREAAAQWETAARASVDSADILLGYVDSLTKRGQITTLALEISAAERAKLTRTGKDLAAQVFAMRDKLANSGITPPDTCLPWVALSDTLARLAGVEGQRAD